jgi:hypothetical protein
MKVGTVIPERQRCPHHNTVVMECHETSTGNPSWTCDECEIDYNLYDLIVESEAKPSFVVLDD